MKTEIKNDWLNDAETLLDNEMAKTRGGFCIGNNNCSSCTNGGKNKGMAR